MMEYSNNFLKKCNLKNRASRMNKGLRAKETVNFKGKIKILMDLKKYGEWQ